MVNASQTPLISIGVSTYNRKDLLRESLKSLLAQTFEDYEIIVVDDGSSDGTEAMVKSEFPGVRYYYKENGGDASAKNYAAGVARGKYIVFNDSDDCFYPDALERLYNALQGHPGDCSYGQYRHLDTDGRESEAKLKMKVFPSGDILPQLIDHIIVHSTASLMPRETFLKCGGYDESLRTGHDYKLILEMALQCRYFAVEKPVFQRRRHSGNISAENYAGTVQLFQIVLNFYNNHPELSACNRKRLRRRLASVSLKSARDARKEGKPLELIRQHCRAALGYYCSLTTLIYAAYFSFIPAKKRQDTAKA